MARRGSLEVASHLAALQRNSSLVGGQPGFGRRSVQRPAGAAASPAAGGAAYRRSSLPTDLSSAVDAAHAR
jgi:hypothetical protein